MDKYSKINKQAHLGELKAIEYFIKNGFEVYKQYTGKESIDLVTIKDYKVYRVECKSTARRSKCRAAWVVKICKTRHNSKGYREITFDQWKENVDIISVYIEPIDYLLLYHKDEIRSKYRYTIKDEIIEVRNNDNCFKYEIFNNNVEEE